MWDRPKEKRATHILHLTPHTRRPNGSQQDKCYKKSVLTHMKCDTKAKNVHKYFFLWLHRRWRERQKIVSFPFRRPIFLIQRYAPFSSISLNFFSSAIHRIKCCCLCNRYFHLLLSFVRRKVWMPSPIAFNGSCWIHWSGSFSAKRTKLYEHLWEMRA